MMPGVKRPGKAPCVRVECAHSPCGVSSSVLPRPWAAYPLRSSSRQPATGAITSSWTGPATPPTGPASGSRGEGLGGHPASQAGTTWSPMHLRHPVRVPGLDVPPSGSSRSPIAFLVTRHLCLALQRADQQKLREGETYGIAAVPEPDSGGPDQAPVNQPLPEEMRASLVEARQPAELLRPTPQHLIPLPRPRRVTARVPARLNHFYVRTRLENPESLAHCSTAGGRKTASRRTRARRRTGVSTTTGYFLGGPPVVSVLRWPHRR